MSKGDLLDRIVSGPTDRRKFVQRVGASGLGIAAMTMLGGTLGKMEAATGTDGDILNFALNLEYLEAEFYSMASYGTTIEEQGIIPHSAVSGSTRGGKMVKNFASSNIAYLASALREDEGDHVVYLRKALGSAAVKKPAINLDALGFGFDGIHDFLRLAVIFEDVGVSAYLGTARLIQSKTYLDAAARILSTEAQHAGAVRVEALMWGVKVPTVDSADVPPTQTKPFDVDKSALSIPRTTSRYRRSSTAVEPTPVASTPTA